MPPESPVNEEELNELLEQFKEANATLYQQLISVTGANDETLKNFIAQIAKNEKLNADSVKNILTATADSDESVQTYLDNFVNNFEQVTNNSQEQITNILSGFGSQTASYQKNLERLQAKGHDLSKATEAGIGNLNKLLTSLSNTYSIMAQVQGDIVQTAQYDASTSDGRSVEGGLLVELSNVSEFDSSINKFQDQITTLSDELVNAGRYISDIQRKRIENVRAELGLEKGILEARKLTSAAIQDANGNFIDLEKTVDKATKLAEQFTQNIENGASHLNRQLDIGKELQVLRKEEVASAILSGQMMSDQVKSHKQIADEVNKLVTNQEKVKFLNDEITKQQKFQQENAEDLATLQSKLPEYLEKQKKIRDELATTSDATRRFELETNLDEVQSKIDDTTNLMATMDASKKSTIILEAQVRGLGDIEESEDRTKNLNSAISENKDAIDDIKKSREDLIKVMQEGTTTDIISNVQGLYTSTTPMEIKEKLSSKGDFQEAAKRMIEELDAKIGEHQKEIAEREQDITKEKQNQIESSKTLQGIQQGAASDAQKAVKDAKKGIGELVKAQEEQIKSATWGSYTDSAIASLDALEDKILSTVDKIPFFGSAIKAHLSEPLKKVKSEIAKEFGETFNEIGSNIAKTKRLDMGGVSTQEDYTKHVGPKTKQETEQIEKDIRLSTSFVTDTKEDNRKLLDELNDPSVTKERASEIQGMLDQNKQEIQVQQDKILVMKESLDIQDKRDSQSDLQKKISEKETKKVELQQKIEAGPKNESQVESLQSKISQNQNILEAQTELQNQSGPLHKLKPEEREKHGRREQFIQNLQEKIKADQSSVEDFQRTDKDAMQEMEAEIKTIEAELKVDQTALDEVSGELQNIDEFEIKTPFEFMNEGFAKLKDRITEIAGTLKTLFNPAVLGMAVLAGLLFTAFKRFVSLEGAAEDFRKEVGLGKDQTAEVEAIARNVNAEFQKFGVSLEKSFAAASALTEQFGTLVGATRENVEMVALMSANLGVSEANASGALDIFTQIGDGTSETARNSMALATGMAKAAGVPLDKVMEDVAGASDETLSLIRGSTTELIKAAVEARRLGTNLETLSGAASKFLDFESSINAEMEASVFAGKALNFQKARQLAFEGDLVGMQKEAMNVIKSAGEFTEMSYHQQQKLAEAAGMTVGEINKQLTREQQLEAMKHGTAEQQKMYNRYMQMQNDLQDDNKDKLVDQGMEMMRQELMQSKLTQMKERFNALMVQLGEKLLPLVEIGFSILVPIVKVLFEVANLLLMPFTLLSDVVRALTGDFSGLSERFGSFGSVAHTVLGLILGGILLIKTNFLGLGGAISSVGSMVSGLWGTISGGVSSLGPALSGMFSGASSGVSTLMEGTKKFFTSAMEGASSLGSKLKDSLGNLFGGGGGAGPGVDDITDVVPDIDTPDIDTGSLDQSSGIIDKFNSIDMMQAIKGAGALLILAGALWVSAKAFQEFGKVTWDGVLKGTVALGVLVGGLYAIGKVMDQNADKILKGSLAIAAIGAALLPAAYAFDMFGDVNWGGLLFGITALGALTVAIMAIGAIMKSGVGAAALLAGAAAIAVLGVALVPAAYAMDIMSDAFTTFTGALNTLEWESIAKIVALQLSFALFGVIAPAVLIGAASVLVMGAAIAVLAAGAWVLSDALGKLGPAITSLGDSAGSLALFAASIAYIGLISPLLIFGAGALAILGLAMIPVAAASILIGAGFSLMAKSISEVGDANLVGIVLQMGAAFALLALMSPILVLGAAALTIMTAALIPFSLALVVAGAGAALFGLGMQMTMDALKDAPEAAAGLLAFAGAVAIVGIMAPLIVFGALALGILGVGLALLAVPLLVVSAAMYVMGGAMKLMSDAIESMADAGAIGIIFGLGAAFMFLAFTFPLIALGALSMTLMTMSLLPLSAAMFMAGMGMKMLTQGIQNLKPALEELSGSGPALDEFLEMMTKIGFAAPMFLFAGIAMSLAAFGATLLGGALMVLGLGMEMIAPPLESITDSLGGLVNDLTELGDVGPGLIAAAVGIGAIGIALLALSAGRVVNGIASLFDFGGDPIEQFVRLGKQGPKLEKAGKAIKSFADASRGMGNMEDMLEDVADGLEDLFDIMDDAPRGINETMKSVGEGMKGLLDGFSGVSLSADVDYADALEGIADGIDEIFGVLEDVDVSIAPNLSIIGDGMKSLLPAFAGDIVGNISEDIDDILEAVGEGLEEFFSSMEDIDPVVLPILPQIGPSVSQMLTALGSGDIADFDADLDDIFEDLGDGLVEFMSSMSDIDPAQMEGMGGIGSAINDILSGIGEIGEINFDSDDLADIFEDMGPAIDAFLKPLKKVDDKVLEAAASVGQALGAVFGSLGAVGENADLDWEDVLEGFGDGVEELFDELEDIDPDTFGQAILVGDVMAQVFASLKDVQLNESIGDAIGGLGDGIEDFFDEVEHIDMETAPQVLEVTRLIGRTISYLPIDKLGAIPENIDDIMDNLGEGIYDFMDSVEEIDVIEKETMVALALGIREIVPVVSGEAMLNIPDDIEDILDNVGEAVYDMFDSLEEIDMSIAIPMGDVLGGMGTFFQGLADMSDSFVDVGVIKDMGVAFSEIMKTMTNMNSGDVDADAMASRFQSLGDGMKNIMESFGEMDLSAFAGIDIGGLLGGVASGIGAMVDLVDGDNGIFGMFGNSGVSEQEQTQLFEEFSKRMKSLGDGVSSIMGSFNTDQLSALGDIELDDIMYDMADGISSLMNLVDFDSMFDGFDSEEEESAYFEEISKRMQDMGTGINSLMTAFPDVSVIQSLGNVDIEDVSENMAEGIDELFDEMSDIDASDVDLKVVDKFVKITDAMNLVADVGPQMNLTLGGLQSIASQEFVEGMANATNAIHDFALAVQGLSEIEGLSAIEVATNMDGIPKEEQLSSSEFSDFTLPTLDMSTPADSTPIIIETTPMTTTTTPTSGSGNVEAKLDTLISLMKSGGIAVNLDGKKVSKTLAQSIESG